jgi:hypothetical protein
MTSPELQPQTIFYDIYDLMKSYDNFSEFRLRHTHAYDHHDLGHFSLVLVWTPNSDFRPTSNHFKTPTFLQSLNQKIKIPFQLGSFPLVPFSQ